MNDSRILFDFTSTGKKMAGLLVPVFALRHSRDHGIGDTLAVRNAFDFCARHGFAVLQTLPIHECVGDFSPYNAISSQALSPSLLALSPDEVPGLSAELLEKEAPDSWVQELRRGNVKHQTVQKLKLQVLFAAHRAFRGGIHPLRPEFELYEHNAAEWLPGYTLFRLLVQEYEGNTDWTQWRPEHQDLDSAEKWLECHPDRPVLAERREGFAFIQWVAWRQWKAVREHADRAGVFFMGEMSYGVSRCSADVWQFRDLFDLEWNVGSQPTRYFDTNKDSEKWGQNWGLPFYRWENHRSTGFAWLRRRLAGERQFFHICRLDHLRGYFRAYMFPWPGGPRHAEFAKLSEAEVSQRTGGKLPRFVPGPDHDPASAQRNDLQGRELIGVMREAAGEMYLVAELMGILPDYMRTALDDLQMPNLTFPQLERNADGSFQPLQAFRPLSLATYANHDHAPLKGYYAHLHEQAKAPEGPVARDLAGLLRFVDWKEDPPAELNEELWGRLVFKLFQSPCQLAVVMSSDLLGILQRFNLPGSYGSETWNERLELPLEEYERHSLYAARIGKVGGWIRQAGRHLEA